MAILVSKKNVGKTEIAFQLYSKLIANGKKVCLLDLDLRKGGLTNKYFSEFSTDISSISDFIDVNNDFQKKGNLFVPKLKIENPPEFFMSDECKEFLEKWLQKLQSTLQDKSNKRYCNNKFRLPKLP